MISSSTRRKKNQAPNEYKSKNSACQHSAKITGILLHFPRKSQKIEMENDKFIKVKRLNLEETAPEKIEGEATAGEKKEGDLGRAAKVVALARNSRSCDR